MDLNHLTDNELIDYVLRYDDDPIRVRLATHMARVEGSIIDDLENAGMDEVFCTFTSAVNGSTYHPGQYITHLEDEISYLESKISEQEIKLNNLKARTVAELIAELRQEIDTAELQAVRARNEKAIAEEKAIEATHKLDMWAILQR